MGDALATVALGTGRTARAVAAAGDHSCALFDDGSLKSWGQNANGGLGLGDLVARGNMPGQMGDALPAVSLGTSHTAHAVVTGSGFTCALLDDSSVKCWGFGGLLGLGDTTSRGGQPGDMGDSLPAVNLGTGP